MTDANVMNENEFASMGIDPAHYEALERDFREVLQQMVGERSMERFRAEYEKLHRALKTSYESEKKLVKKCKELNDTIMNNATRVKAAIKMTQDDASTIGVLRREVEKAWKLVEQAKDKEEKARKIIQDLKGEIAHLHKIVQRGSGLSFSQDNTVTTLMQQKQDLKKQVEQKDQHVAELEVTKQTLQSHVTQLQADNQREKDDIDKLRQDHERLKEDLDREKRKFKNTDTQNKQLLDQIEQNKRTEKDLQGSVERLNENVKLLNQETEELQENKKQLEVSLKEAEKEKDAIIKENNKANKEINQCRNKIEELDILKGQSEAKERQLEKDNNRLNRDNQHLTRDKARLADAKLEAENEKIVAKNAVSALTREIEWLRKETEAEYSNIMSLVRDRDMMKKSISTLDEANQSNLGKLREKEQQMETLKEENRSNKTDLEQMLKTIQAAERERDKFCSEASKANANLMQMVEEVKLKKNLIGELKKENIDFEAKLKQQQNLYEAVRSDRNCYSKNLIEAQDQVHELKRKFRVATHQISQLKDEIESKDQAIAKEHHDYGVACKDKDVLDQQFKAEKAKKTEVETALKKAENSIQKLNHIIRDAWNDQEAMKAENKKIVSERDIVATQLIRRNDELALLYEKIKILQTTLGKGEVQYQERLKDIKCLQYKIGDLKCELRIVKAQAEQIGQLKDEVYNLQQQLLTERLQVKALSEELENPLNYHRWRKLDGTDPDTWEMLQKIQTLQKRLIKKTEEVVEKDVIIQEKEKLYVELKNLLARQPGPEVAEQLSIYQQNLKEKTNQMKAMAAELNMYQAQVNEYKYEIERLTRELQEMKRKYYEQKRREQMQREAQNRMEAKAIHQQTGPQQRFTGGGFNLAI